MGLTTHIKNLIFLWRQRNKTEIPKNVNLEIILSITKNNYKRKNSWVRNQVVLLIRKIRKEKPYKIKNYSKAKKFYENQPKGIDFSKVKKGSYVVKFTEEYAVKGRRWCEYYINFTSGTGVFKVGKWNDSWKYFMLKNYRGDYGNSINEENSIMFHFATKEEIQEFKNNQKEYKAKRKEIDKLQEKISKLYKKL